MSLPPSYLAAWPGRFRYPRLCVELAADTADHIVAALLWDLAADLGDGDTLGYLLDAGEFPTAIALIDASPWFRDHPTAARDAHKRLRRRQQEAADEIADELELLLSRAEAAGVSLPADLPELSIDEAFRLPPLREQIEAAKTALQATIDAARSEARTGLNGRRPALSEVLLAAWRQRISRGQLVAAERLLAVGDQDGLPPDAVPQLSAWDPTVDPVAALERMRGQPRGGPWPSDLQGQLLLETYRDLGADPGADTAEAFRTALVEFLGGTPARRLRPYPGGYVFRLDLSPVAAVLPLPWLSDVTVAIQIEDSPVPPVATDADRVIVVAVETGLKRAGQRAEHAVLSASDLIRLSTATEHRGLHLLRLVGQSWTARAVGIADADALGRLLSGPEKVAWTRLSWLVDILGLGGAELTRELINETGLHPAGLHILLEHMLRPNWDPTRGALKRLGQTMDAHSQLVEAVLPPATPRADARIVVLAALAADGYEEPLQLADLELSIAVEGGHAPTSQLERGLNDLMGHPLVEIDDHGVRLLRCHVLTRLRDDAQEMLLELLGINDAEQRPAERAWARHRWALLAEDVADRSVDILIERRSVAIERAALGSTSHDVVGVIDLMVAELVEAHPGLDVDLDLPSQAPTSAPLDAFRTILAEMLQNAVDELAASGQQRLRIAVNADGDDVLVDVIDDGNGVQLTNPHAVFKQGRSLRSGARGRGLYDGERLARRLEGRLDLVAPVGAGPLSGAHFRLILPQAESSTADVWI